MKQPTLQKWVRIEDDREEVERERTTRRRVVSLFDRHGIAVLPWADMGFECTAYDCATAHGNGPAEADLTASAAGHGTVRIERVRLKDADDVRGCLGRIDDLAFVIAIPPCRDLCAAGARWWRKKRGRNPEFQKVAEEYLKQLYATLDNTGVPFIILVPSSPYIRRCFSRRAFAFSPHEFGGYLPPTSPHPLFREIPAQDAYTKRTLCFYGHGVRMPWKKAVPPTFHTIRLKSGRTKRVSPVMASRRNTASRTSAPFAFCTAVASVNASV